MKNVYIVQYMWSDLRDEFTKTKLFAKHKDAWNYFNEIVSKEKDSKHMWEVSTVDENGNLLEGFDLDYFLDEECAHCWWALRDKANYHRHVSIDLYCEQV